MKKIKVIAAVLLAAFPFLAWAADKTGAAAPQMKTFDEKISYVIGRQIGQSLEGTPAKFDLKLLMRGIEDALGKRPSPIGAEEEQQVKTEFSAKVKEEQSKKWAAAAEANLKAEEAFLAKNKSEKGVVTTASGLQYQVLKKGSGPTPKESDRVRVHYRGTLLDGTEFDSSYARKEPAVFNITGVIPGWTEALQLMPAGSTYRVFIPAKLAYGGRGAAPAIGPNAMLVFEVELLEIAQ